MCSFFHRKTAKEEEEAREKKIESILNANGCAFLSLSHSSSHSITSICLSTQIAIIIVMMNDACLGLGQPMSHDIVCGDQMYGMSKHKIFKNLSWCTVHKLIVFFYYYYFGCRYMTRTHTGRMWRSKCWARKIYN